MIANQDGDTFKAEDYFLSGQAQCANGIGICTGTIADPPDANSITGVSGERTPDTMQNRYPRPMATSTFVSWAFGPYNSDIDLPQFHRDECSI